MEFEQLKLENQLCFPVYAASRLIIREYQPFLDELEITYPQYITLMVLWEKDGISVNDITNKLILNTNTVTPLLKRLEEQGFITRKKSETDERKVIIDLTEKGHELKLKAASIPERLVASVSNTMNMNDLIDLKNKLCTLVDSLLEKNKLTD